MRWNKPIYGETREISQFAIIPVLAGYEWRWLELVVIEQRYNGFRWENMRFKRGT